MKDSKKGKKCKKKKCWDELPHLIKLRKGHIEKKVIKIHALIKCYTKLYTEKMEMSEE